MTLQDVDLKNILTYSLQGANFIMLLDGNDKVCGFKKAMFRL